MEVACRRLCQVDTSGLPDIVNYIEVGHQAPTSKLGAKAFTALATHLLRESCASGSALPSGGGLPLIAHSRNSRHADEGHTVRSVLVSLGLQRCRDMTLDAYFALKRWQRYYVIMFVTLLVGVYGCCPQDLLRSAASRNALIGSTDSGRVSPAPEGTIQSTELIPARPNSTARVAAVTVGRSGGATSPTGQVNLHPFAVMRGSVSPPRRVSIPSRSAVQVSIPGTSTDLPVQPA
ncbi:hypothetical protein CUR178_03823 [Leishmania enriettii]|uniref:Uncharacterized protein n=1 Tax=Leishmania enriettii TaxID=5663 RepID=A0A836HGY8_LEIEN|nr:hypothetical protein CUR178_03823 [Leishmania enriettii]